MPNVGAMSHALVMALFQDAAVAAGAARTLRGLGIPRERVSIVARSHDEEGVIADAAGASPGSEIEDSRAASRLGELAAHLAAAVAVVIPGVGPIVADGPLSAALGEAAGHVGGDIARALEKAGLSRDDAGQWEKRIEEGAFLVGAHADKLAVDTVREALIRAGGSPVAVGRWSDT
jgi:hypothetical protein